MRKTEISKNVIHKGNVVFGMTKGQLIAVILAGILAIGEVVLGITILHLNLDLVMFIAFFSVVAICGCGVVKLNGMPLVKYLFLVFALADDVRLYNSKGGLHRTDDLD